MGSLRNKTSTVGDGAASLLAWSRLDISHPLSQWSPQCSMPRSGKLPPFQHICLLLRKSMWQSIIHGATLCLMPERRDLTACACCAPQLRPARLRCVLCAVCCANSSPLRGARFGHLSFLARLSPSAPPSLPPPASERANAATTRQAHPVAICCFSDLHGPDLQPVYCLYSRKAQPSKKLSAPST